MPQVEKLLGLAVSKIICCEVGQNLDGLLINIMLRVLAVCDIKKKWKFSILLWCKNRRYCRDQQKRPQTLSMGKNHNQPVNDVSKVEWTFLLWSVCKITCLSENVSAGDDFDMVIKKLPLCQQTALWEVCALSCFQHELLSSMIDSTDLGNRLTVYSIV